MRESVHAGAQWAPTRGHPLVQGGWKPEFEPVVAEFEANFTKRGDLGAAFALYRGGEAVVDIWGGVRDRVTGAAWESETASVTFSASKGVLSICLAMLIDRGMLNLDWPVSRYWPEFAAAGKAQVTVRQALGHTAGLPHVDTPLTRADVLGWDPVVEALAAQAPRWAPGEHAVYHALTFGWLGGELIRRVTGFLPGQFLEQEIAAPLGLVAWFGVPQHKLGSLARIEPPAPETNETARDLWAAVTTDEHFVRAVTLDGALPFPGLGGDETYNSADVLTAEVPAANLVATARSLARIYAACIGHGVDGTRLVSKQVLDDMVQWRSGAGKQPPLGNVPTPRWGAGFLLDSDPLQPMLGPSSFGHDGAGGQLAFANRDKDVAFAYLTNQMGPLMDDRAKALCRAVDHCLAS